MQLHLKDCGLLTIEYGSLKGFGGDATRSFLYKVIKNAVIRSAEYTRASDYGDHIDTYTEQQLHSVLCPAISDITKRKFLFEYPLKRKWRGKEAYAGHIDYWASYDSKSYILEVKHAYLSYNSKEPALEIKAKLDDALDQLRGVKNTFPNDHWGRRSYYYGIALEWITFRMGSSDKQKLASNDTNRIRKAYLRLKEKVGLAQASALWVLDETLAKPIQFDNEKFVKFPAVAFIAKMPY
jgi:hypothetical protein